MRLCDLAEGSQEVSCLAVSLPGSFEARYVAETLLVVPRQYRSGHLFP